LRFAGSRVRGQVVTRGNRDQSKRLVASDYPDFEPAIPRSRGRSQPIQCDARRNHDVQRIDRIINRDPHPKIRGLERYGIETRAFRTNHHHHLFIGPYRTHFGEIDG